MSFIEYIVSNIEYRDFGNLFGITRALLWWIVLILNDIANAFESLYNNVFQLFSVIYSNQVTTFIKGWTGFLWIPIAISIFVLGYNLITSDDVYQKHLQTKKFVQNIMLLLLVIFALPLIFTGTNSSSNNALGYVFTSEDSSGVNSLVSANKTLAGSSTASFSVNTIANGVVDLKSVFMQTYNAKNNGTVSFTSEFASSYIGKDKTIKPNTYIANSSKIKEVLFIDICEVLDSSDMDSADYFGNYKDSISKFAVTDYDIIYAKTDLGAVKDFSTDASPATVTEDVPAYKYLFQVLHSYVDHESNVTINSNGKTAFSIPIVGDVDFISAYVFRYRVDFASIIITLITTCLVLFMASLKVVKIIYDIAVNQLIAVFFAAGDLSNGQKAREVIKSIFSLIISLFFVTVLIQFYYVVCGYIQSTSFPITDGFQKSLILFFVGIATIKGPDVLQRILGTSGGFRAEAGELTSAAFAGTGAVRAVKGATTGAFKAVGKTIGGVGNFGAKVGNYTSGKRRAKKEHKNADKINRANGYTGDREVFSPNVGKQKPSDELNLRENPEGYKKQEEKIKDKLDNYDSQSERDVQKRAKIAADNKDDLLNDALSKSFNNEGMSDKEALSKALSDSGFNNDEVERFANKSLLDGSFDEKKNAFDNSISVSANAKYNSNPEAYEHQSDAYVEAAKEHFEALDVRNPEEKAVAYGKQLCAVDNQNDIRQRAREIQNSYAEKSTSAGDRLSDVEAVRMALTNNSQRGVAGGYNYAPTSENVTPTAEKILQSGSLSEGIVQGRLYNNAVQEKVATNQRAEALNTRGGLITGTQNYMTKREREGSYQTGYNKVNRSKAKKAVKREKNDNF